MQGTGWWTKRLAMAVLVAGLGLASCSSGDGSDGAGRSGGSTTTSTVADDGKAEDVPAVKEHPTFTEGDCWWPRPENAPTDLTITCGTVEVPSDRSDPDTPMLHLAAVRLHRASADASAPPLVYLHGGPGGSALVGGLGGLPALDVLADHDLIAYDQRGTGLSTPSLNCPEKEEAILDALGAAGRWDDEYAANRKAVQACYERLSTTEGVQLDDYDTPASVEDLESIRIAMGVDTWDVWGVSYGTRLGLAYARTHPEPIRSLLIDSVYAPNVGGVERARSLPGGAVDRLAAACAEQPACASADGDVSAELSKAEAAFDADPAELSGTFDLDGTPTTRDFVLTGPDVRAGMFAALYDSDLIPALPGIIHGLANGDRSILPTFISTGVPRLTDLTEGAFYSVECADNGPLLDPDAQAEALADPGEDGLIALGTAEAFCDVWPVEAVDPSFNEPVTADVPTLVIGGTLDPITPYPESKAQAERMPDATFMTVPGGGHGPGGDNDCTRSARTAFWQDPSLPDGLPACVAALTMPTFGT